MSESLNGLTHTMSQTPKASVLALRGEIDMATGKYFSVQLDEALATSDQVLVVDMTGIDFLGSAGLAALITFQDKAESQGVEVRVVCGPTTRRVIELTGLTERFRLAGTAAAALAMPSLSDGTPV